MKYVGHAGSNIPSVVYNYRDQQVLKMTSNAWYVSNDCPVVLLTLCIMK